MERGYRVLEVAAEAVEAGLPRLLDDLAQTMAED